LIIVFGYRSQTSKGDIDKTIDLKKITAKPRRTQRTFLLCSEPLCWKWMILSIDRDVQKAWILH